MKNKFYFALLSLFFMFTQCAYDKDSLEEDCKQHDQTEIERSFHLGIFVMYQDSVPYYGMVYLTTEKSYCNGDLSGKFNLKGNPDEDGYWSPSQAPTYKFANAFDRVDVNFHVSIDGKSYELHDEYFYVDVEQQYFGINKDYVLIIPLDSYKSDPLKN